MPDYCKVFFCSSQVLLLIDKLGENASLACFLSCQFAAVNTFNSHTSGDIRQIITMLLIEIKKLVLFLSLSRSIELANWSVNSNVGKFPLNWKCEDDGDDQTIALRLAFSR